MKQRKITAWILAIMMIMSMIPVMSMGAAAAADVTLDQDYFTTHINNNFGEYKVDGDGEPDPDGTYVGHYLLSPDPISFVMNDDVALAATPGSVHGYGMNGSTIRIEEDVTFKGWNLLNNVTLILKPGASLEEADVSFAGYKFMDAKVTFDSDEEDDTMTIVIAGDQDVPVIFEVTITGGEIDVTTAADAKEIDFRKFSFIIEGDVTLTADKPILILEGNLTVEDDGSLTDAGVTFNNVPTLAANSKIAVFDDSKAAEARTPVNSGDFDTDAKTYTVNMPTEFVSGLGADSLPAVANVFNGNNIEVNEEARTDLLLFDPVTGDTLEGLNDGEYTAGSLRVGALWYAFNLLYDYDTLWVVETNPGLNLYGGNPPDLPGNTILPNITQTPNGAWVKESAITKAVYASTATGAGIGFLRVPDSEAKFEFYTDNTKTTKLFTVIVKHDSEATDVVDDDAEYKHRYNPKTERIEFVKVDEDGEMTDELVDINGAWFYALKYNAAKASKTKWIPVYGSSIDVSKLIKKEVTIPLVSAANVTKVTDSPAETVVIPLKIAARDAGPGKGAASYASNGELKVPKGHDWRVGNGAWISVGDTDLTRKFEATDFPYGSIIEVRKSATATVAASLKVQKVKVAGQPAQPKVDIDSGKAYIKGFKDTMEITFAGSTELKDGIQVQKWISGPSKADNKQEKWEELIKDAVVNEGTTDKVDVRIRVKEGKKPYSVEKVLTLTKGTPAASQADVGPVESAAAAAGNDTVTVAITAPTTGSPAFKAGTTPGAVDKANFEVKKGTSELAPTAYTASLIDGKVVIKLNTPLLVDETMTITAKKEAFTDAAIVTAISVTLSTTPADPEP